MNATTGFGRKCWEFTPEFSLAFNTGHAWLVNNTQDILAPLGGPVIDGPYSGKYNTDVCDFPTMQKAVAKGLNGTGEFVLEASRGGCTPDASCIASYLLAAEEFVYLGCLADEPQLPLYPDLARPLGPPTGPAVQGSDGVWSRSFEHGAVARWYPNASEGTMQWPGEPTPPAPAPPPPVPPDPEGCGTALADHTFSGNDVASRRTNSAEACCHFCEKEKTCTQWAWHGSTDSSCHMHNANARFRVQRGTTAGFMPNATHN